MGDKGVRLILPSNDCYVSLPFISFVRSKQAANANLILTNKGGLLRENIEQCKLKPTKSYRFSFLVNVMLEW